MIQAPTSSPSDLPLISIYLHGQSQVPRQGLSPLVLILVRTPDQYGRAPVPQLEGLPNSARLAWLILSPCQASNWVIQTENVQTKWSCALLIHSRGQEPAEDQIPRHYARSLSKPRVRNQLVCAQDGCTTTGRVQMPNALIPSGLKMARPVTEVNLLADKTGEQNASLSSGSSVQ